MPLSLFESAYIRTRSAIGEADWCCMTELQHADLICGTPETAPAAILADARQAVQRITTQREATARRIAAAQWSLIVSDPLGQIVRRPIG
jgi:hypothetical protein